MSSVFCDVLKRNIVVGDTHLPISELQYTNTYRVVNRIYHQLSIRTIAASDELCNQTGMGYLEETAVVVLDQYAVVRARK